jgi:hypothetical protein
MYTGRRRKRVSNAARSIPFATLVVLSCLGFTATATSDADLLLASVSGPDIAALYQWWTTKG